MDIGLKVEGRDLTSPTIGAPKEAVGNIGLQRHREARDNLRRLLSHRSTIPTDFSFYPHPGYDAKLFG